MNCLKFTNDNAPNEIANWLPLCLYKEQRNPLAHFEYFVLQTNSKTRMDMEERKLRW